MKLTGWKTYLAAAAMIAYGAHQAINHGDHTGGGQMILQGIGLLGLRAAVGKTIKNTE